jgi:hypothetical protein
LHKRHLPATPIKIALPAGRRVPTRVRALVDFLATKIAAAQMTWRERKKTESNRDRVSDPSR